MIIVPGGVLVSYDCFRRGHWINMKRPHCYPITIIPGRGHLIGMKRLTWLFYSCTGGLTHDLAPRATAEVVATAAAAAERPEVLPSAAAEGHPVTLTNVASPGEGLGQGHLLWTLSV